MTTWGLVAQARAAYEAACHEENVANEVNAVAISPATIERWQRSREMKAAAFAEYSAAYRAARKSGQPHPEDKP